MSIVSNMATRARSVFSIPRIALFFAFGRCQIHGLVNEWSTDVRDDWTALSPLTSLLSARKKPIRIGITSFDPTCISTETKKGYTRYMRSSLCSIITSAHLLFWEQWSHFPALITLAQVVADFPGLLDIRWVRTFRYPSPLYFAATYRLDEMFVIT